MLGKMVASARADKYILLTALTCGSILLLLLASKSIWGLSSLSVATNSVLYFFVVILYVGWRILKLIVIERPNRLLATIWQRGLTAERRVSICRAISIVVALCVFMPIFSTMKSAIPLFSAFQWDNSFIEADRAIFGTDAWQLFYPAMFHPYILALIAFLYHLWILLIYAGGLYFAFKLDQPELRERYFISYFLSWTVIGSFMALAFASVGPCFVQPLFGIDDFEPLMALLEKANSQIPIMVLDVQAELLLWQKHGEDGLGRGITAMPSMHVSLALLFFLAMRQVSAKAGWLFGGFFAVICIGSVVTGYHYAVDGIVSAFVTCLIWFAVGYAQKLLNPAAPPLADVEAPAPVGAPSA
jgi:hypothetical protein